jgi:hypothetical protein
MTVNGIAVTEVGFDHLLENENGGRIMLTTL